MKLKTSKYLAAAILLVTMGAAGVWHGTVEQTKGSQLTPDFAEMPTNRIESPWLKAKYGFDNMYRHKSGEYFLAYRNVTETDIVFVVETFDGTVLYESTEAISLMGRTGYGVQYLDPAEGEGRCRLLNLYTGQVKYVSPSHESIVEGLENFWVCYEYIGQENQDNIFCFLDNNFQMAMDGRRFAAVYTTEDYIFGHVYINPAAGAACENWFPVVYSKYGELLYEGEPGYYAVGMERDTILLADDSWTNTERKIQQVNVKRRAQ